MKIKEWIKKHKNILGILCISPMGGWTLCELIKLHIEQPASLLVYPGCALVVFGIYLLMGLD